MKRFVALFLVIAVAQAAPSGVITPFAVPAISVDFSTQYLAQDSAGQYTYGYSSPLSSKAEVRSLDGVTKGAYNYLDGAGKVQSVSYTADGASGFQLTSATNLPQAPAVPNAPELIPPEPVEDTPEVVEARAKHLDAVKEAEVLATAEPATVVTETKTTIPGVAVKLVNPAPVAPLVSYNFGIPGAAVTYSSYSAPLLTGYNAVVAAPVFNPLLPVPAIPGLPALPGFPAAPAEEQKVDAQNDSVTVEAKEAKE